MRCRYCLLGGGDYRHRQTIPRYSHGQALEIIGNAEGCRRDAYKCPADVLTVGIGSTEASGEKIDPNRKYSDQEIADRWRKDRNITERGVISLSLMTKEATARLGIANLNRLNYGGVGAMAAMAGAVAMAQPMPAIQVDNRPPIARQALHAKPSSAIHQNIQITINASPNQSEAEIARQVQKALEQAQRRAEAKGRSSLRDRG